MRTFILCLAATATSISGLTFGDENSPDSALVVTSPELAGSWTAYAEWKTRLGIPTTVVTTVTIDDSISGEGVDLQEKIRQFVRESIDTKKVRSVILGGDSQPEGINHGGHVPDRDTVHQTMWGKNADIPTDIFYLSQKNWDADGDGVFGEFKEDREAIDYPDGSVGIGRIPVRTPEDVAAYVAKVIEYDSAYPEDEFSQRMVYTCAVPGAEAKLGISWNKEVSPSWPTGKGQMYFTSRTPWDEKVSGDYPLSVNNLINLINKNEVGKFHIHGHGLDDCWVLENDEKFSFSAIEKLENKGAYPILTTVSCFTGQFDSKKDPCITEAMLRAPGAGAIAILAPCREGKPHFTNPQRDFPLMTREGKMDGTTETMTRFWKHAILDQNGTGRAFTATKADLAERASTNANFHMAICELNFLGDPLLAVHADSPETISPDFPKDLKSGKMNFTLSDLPTGSVVTISDGREIWTSVIADESGNATLTGNIPKDTRKLSLAIRGTGFNSTVRYY